MTASSEIFLKISMLPRSKTGSPPSLRHPFIIHPPLQLFFVSASYNEEYNAPVPKVKYFDIIFSSKIKNLI
jgi:hypothetical protein